MAKKYRVKYSFGTPESYANLAKKDDKTVYFIYEEVINENGKKVPGDYGTIYKGNTRIGSALASDIVFNQELAVHVPASATDADSLVYTIEKGTTLAQFAADIIRKSVEWDSDVRDEIRQTIIMESSFDENDSPAITGGTEEHPDHAIISTAINNRLYNELHDASGNYKFVTTDQLGRVEELSRILTPETVDVLINAAQGIEAVLSQYYNKEDVDELIKDHDRVFTADTSAGFPEIGDASTLYVADDENVMYRWALVDDGSTAREYLEITGGGGGSQTVTVETKLFIKDNKVDVTIAKNTPFTFEYAFSSANTFTRYTKRNGFEKVEEQTGAVANVKYYLDGIQIGSGTAQQANYHDNGEGNVYNSYVIPASRFTGSAHVIKVVAEDVLGNTASNEINVSVISVTLTSSYVPVPTPLENTITVPVTVASSTTVHLKYQIDDFEPIDYSTIRVSGMQNANIIVNPTGNGEPLTHGYHILKIWAETYIEETDTTIRTQVLTYSIIWYDANGAPIVSTYMSSDANAQGNYDVDQYNYLTLNYQVYPRGTVELVIEDELGQQTVVNTLTVDTTLKTWSYTFDEHGTFYMFVRATSGGVVTESTKYCAIVANANIDAEAEGGAVLFLTAKNRSNAEPELTRGVWKSEQTDEHGHPLVYTARLTNFNWNDISGWSKDEGSDNRSLKIGGGARVVIPFQPFLNDYTENGQTIEFEFKTSRLSNSDAEVISCYSDTDESGIRIFANGAKFYSTDFSGNNAISVPFKDDEKLRISFVITPFEQDDKGNGPSSSEAMVKVYDPQSRRYTTINSIEAGWWRFVKIYINGVLSMVKKYTNKFRQSAPSYITIGSDEATVDIYSIRAYNKALYDKAIVDNFIADTQDPAQKLYLYKRNLILNESGTDVDPALLKTKMPCMFITCESDSTYAGFTNPGHILPKYKGDKVGCEVIFDSTGITDENALRYFNFCTPFVAFNAQLDVQGTSSQYYPRKNWKIKFKGDKYNSDYNAQVQKKKPTYLYTDTLNPIKGGSENYASKGNYKLKDYSKAGEGVEGSAIDKITSLPAKNYCLKADFMESSGVHNTGAANYIDFILKTLGPDYLTPPQLAQYRMYGGGAEAMNKVSVRTTVEGYPIALFWRPTSQDNYTFYGKFNFNTDKSAENVFGFIDDPVSTLTNPNTGLPFALFDEDYYDAASPQDRYDYEAPVECWEFGDNTSDISKFKNVTDETFEALDIDGKRMWYTAFEVRHPDNDTLIEDYENGKIPAHWKNFLMWVSSTDRNGYHDPLTKLLPIPTAWDGTYEELAAGEVDEYVYETYNGTKEQFLMDPNVDTAIGYILTPKTTTIVDGEEVEVDDESDPDYNHVMVYVNGTWIDNGEYEEGQTAVTSVVYYINNEADASHYQDVYQYKNDAWTKIGTLADYALPAGVRYENTNITYLYDTAEYRLAKFKNELSKHMNINMTVAYYVISEFQAMADQRAKNMMFATWGYEPSQIRPASSFSSVEQALAAGYKPVYKYALGTVAAAPKVMSAPATRGGMLLGAGATNVCINEIKAGADPKYIELYNPTNAAVSLNGWTLKKGDDINNIESDKYIVFDSNAVIDAHGYFVVPCVKKSTDANTLPSGISAGNGFYLRLYDANSNLVDEIDNGALDINGEPKVYATFSDAYGRTEDGGDEWDVMAATSGANNEGGIVPGPTVTDLVSHLSFPTDVTEFSGICFNEDMSGFYAVGDRGDFYEVGFDGSSVAHEVDGLDGADLEALTIDASGNVFAIAENTGDVYKIDTTNYTASVYKTISPVGNNPSSAGFEGFTAYDGGKFIVGNQSNPVVLYLNDGNSTTKIADIDYLTEVGDLCYDGTYLWILDSVQNYLAKADPVTGELIELYALPFISGSSNPEAITVDPVNNMAYIGCDNTDDRELYAVSLTNDPLNKTVVFNEFDPDMKFFELYNTTSSSISIEGYSVTKDNDEATRYTFGAVTIGAHDRLVIPVKSDGIAGPTFGLSATKGFDYRFFDASGNLVDAMYNSGADLIVIPDGRTLARATDGDDAWILLRNHGTIGKSNAEGIADAGIYINEVDTTGNLIGKRFEIYNSNQTPYDLTGHSFVKDGTVWVVVDTAVGEGLGLPTITVPAGGYLTVQCNNAKAADVTAGNNSDVADQTKWPKFGLSGTKGFVLEIKNADGICIDRVDNLITNTFNPNAVVIPEGQTWGRITDGNEHDYGLFATPNLGYANEGGALYTATKVADSSLFINEIDCANDRIELYNASDASISLDGYKLSKDGDTLSMWTLPAGSEIAPAGYFVINLKQWNPALGPIFGLSTSKGFYLTIADASGNVMDVVDNRLDSEGHLDTVDTQAMARVTDGADEWAVFVGPTIGASNETGTIYVPEEIVPGNLITDHLVINEICGDTKEIEIYNPTSSAISLGGNYALVKFDVDGYVNDGIDCDFWVFKNGMEIGANGYFVVTAGAKDPNGPTFGISLKNVSKKFKLFLYRVNGSTDYTSLESIASTATLVDTVNNFDGDIAVCADGSFWTLGRVEDGSENFCIFEGVAGGLAGTIGSSNNNGTRHPIPHNSEGGDDTPSSQTVKTVLYWVPVDCNYIYYPIFYDNDSMLSLDNEGHIKFNPNVESTDIVGSGYAFNGTESALWLNLKDAFAQKISDVYSKLRSEYALTEANCDKFYKEELSDMWPENLYNIDAKTKYIDPATKGYIDFQYADPDYSDPNDPTAKKYGVNRQDATYLYEAQGTRAEHRKWWFNNRFTYMDSRYNCGDYFTNYVTMRIYTPANYNPVVQPNATFMLTPYSDMYLRIRFAKNDIYVRAEKNVPTAVVPPAIKFNDTETIIYGASNILSFGDMADKYARTAQFGNATKVTVLKFGNEAPYYNDNLTEIDLGANNTVLNEVDVRGSRNLATISHLNSMASMKTFRATNTKMTTVDFPTSGSNLRLVQYPAGLRQIKLINMPYIDNENIYVNNNAPADWRTITEVWIEGCPNVNTWAIVNSIMSATGSNLSTLRITDINWNIESGIAFSKWSKILSMSGYNDRGYIQYHDTPYLTGTVNITTLVSTGYKEHVEAKFAEIGCELTVNTSNTADLNGMSIQGDESIATNEHYTYRIQYNPDNYILDAQKGVHWNIPAEFTVFDGGQDGDDFVEVGFMASTSGTNPYTISATSLYDGTITAAKTVLPVATLSAIILTDQDGNEITSEDTIEVDEDSSVIFNVVFVPEKTRDKGIRVVTTNGANALDPVQPYEYDSVSQHLILNTKSVSSDTPLYVRVESTDVSGVASVSANITVKNVISRILTMQDGAGHKLPGTATVRYTNAFTGVTETEVVYTGTGDFVFPANSKFGVEELRLSNIKPTIASSRLYNDVGIVRLNKINPATLTEDVVETRTFFEPVEYTFNIWHDTNAITDASILFYSVENENQYTLTTPPYNNVISSTVQEGGVAYSQIKVRLLANTKHSVSFKECTSEGIVLLNGKTYENLSASITTGTSDATVDIYMTRDYLGDEASYGATQLHMTVKSGIQYTSLRLFVNVTGPITIEWGDGYSTTIDGEIHGTNDYSFNKDIIVTHAYSQQETEYDIWVRSNTANIKWFNVIRADNNVGVADRAYSSYMLPCFFQGSDINNIPTTWEGTVSKYGGLIAYQSVGEATMKAVPTFRFAEKRFSILACVGHIYDKFVNMTSAESLFANTQLEQIPTISIFKYNTNIQSFNSTFANTNIISVPNAFFSTNTKATSFRETFAGCTNLTTLHTSADGVLFVQDPGVEVTDLYHTFYGCSKLTDEVPALWAQYYGCSALRAPYTFDGCVSLGNYSSVPSEWGGIADTYYESSIKFLDYLQLNGGEGYFETDIYPSNNYRYVFDYTCVENHYEGMPIFGSAYATDPTDESTIDTVIDFTKQGSRTGGGAGGWIGCLRYRLGTSVSSDLQSTKIKRGGEYVDYPDLLQPGIFPRAEGSGARVIIDICKTKSGVVTSKTYDAANDTWTDSAITYMPEWNNEQTMVSNLPLRLFASYDNYHDNPVAGEVDGVQVEDVYPTYFIPQQPGRNISKGKFRSLKIYRPAIPSGDRIGGTYADFELIHELVPAYGMIEGFLVPFLYDKVEEKRYLYTPNGDSADILTNLTTNGSYATFYKSDEE